MYFCQEDFFTLLQFYVQYMFTPGLHKLCQPASLAVRKWRENENEEEMEREDEEMERMNQEQ